eukprot:m.30758 g.30758  ORF g.30758 m.30758 type:complete len:60 (+) comp31384_c1_seq4:1130-1309(+)
MQQKTQTSWRTKLLKDKEQVVLGQSEEEVKRKNVDSHSPDPPQSTKGPKEKAEQADQVG